MPRTSCYSAGNKSPAATLLRTIIVALCCLGLAATAQASRLGENLDSFYAREGNDASPAEVAGNNIYLKFFEDRWVGLLFVPYPYASGVGAGTIQAVFAAARGQTESPSYLRGKFGLLQQRATVQIERYGYLGDRIAFECGALSACTIRLGDGYLELIKPGVINEHIVRYNRVVAE